MLPHLYLLVARLSQLVMRVVIALVLGWLVHQLLMLTNQGCLAQRLLLCHWRLLGLCFLQLLRLLRLSF